MDGEIKLEESLLSVFNTKGLGVEEEEEEEDVEKDASGEEAEIEARCRQKFANLEDDIVDVCYENVLSPTRTSNRAS